MTQLFDVGVPAISKHLHNIFSEGELQPESTVSKMEIVQIEGDREYRIIQDRLFQSDFDRFNDNLLSLDTE